MQGTELLGWTAAALTLSTFLCREMRRLRLLALAANAAFIGYGALAGLLPVLALHLLLVPVNLWRLNQALRPAAPAAGPRRSRRRRRRHGAAANAPLFHTTRAGTARSA